MEFNELKEKLVVQGNTFTLPKQVLTTEVDDWLDKYLPDKTLKIDSPSKTETEDKVIISGTMDIFNVTAAPSEATFSVDSGKVIVVLKVTLDPKTWSFYQSFPDILGEDQNVFSEIGYAECCLLLADAVVKNYEDGFDLYEGINFSGQISNSPLMTLVENTINVIPIMRGHITPDDGAVREPLAWGDYPFKDDSPETPLQGFVFKVELQGLSQFECGDYVIFDQLALHLYSPPCAEFVERNSSYSCKFGFFGRMQIPALKDETDEEITCWINYVPQWFAFEVSIDSDISISTFEKLIALCGGNNPHDSLPPALQALQLNTLTLSRFCIDFNLASGTPELDDVMLTLALEGAEWQVLPSTSDPLTIKEISSTFTYVPGKYGMDSRFGVSVSGIIEKDDHRLAVRADNENGFTLYLDMLDEIDIPLKDFLAKYWSGLEPPTDLAINNIRAEISPSDHVEVLLKMASDGKDWVIPVGPVTMKMSDILLFYQYQSGDQTDGSHSGFFSGTIAFNDQLKLTANCNVPFKNGVSILMYLPDFSLKDFIEKFGGDTTFLPDAFDFTLTQSMVQFEKEQDNYHLRLATLVDNCGLMMLDLLSGSQGKGFIFGINIDGDKLGGVLGLPDLSKFNEMFALKQLVLIASTTDLNGYSFPGTEQFDVPALKDHEMNNPSGGNLIKGLNFMARWSINTGNAVQNMLRNLLNLDLDMLVVLQIGTSNEYRLYAEMDGKICEVPIKAQVGAKYSGGELAFFVAGSMTFIIQEHPQEFVLEIGVTTGGAYGSGTMKSQVPLDFGIIKLGNLALQIGVSWEGVPTIGIAGNIMLGEKLNSSIAILFDSENPAKSMVAGSVSNFTLADVFDAFLPENCQSKQLAAESITDVKEILSWFKLTGTNTFDLSTDLTEKFDGMVLDDISKAFAEHGVTISSNINEVYYSIGAKETRWYIASLEKNRPRYYEIEKTKDETTGEEVLRVYTEAQFYMVPEKTNIGALVYDRGFYLNGRLTFKDFFFEGEVDIEEDRFTARAEMSKVELGNGLLCLSGVNDDGTPSDKGPELRISTIGPDYGYLNAYISFLGFKSKWKGIVNENGFDVSFDVEGLVAKTTLTTRLCGTDSFFAEVGMEFEPVIFKALDYLGKSLNINLKTSAIGTATIEVSKEKGFKMSVSASFFLFGKKVELFDIMVGVTPKDIKDIVDAVYEAIKEYILGLLKDAEMFAKMVLDNIVEGIKDLGKALMELFNKTLEEAMAIIDKAKEFLAKVCAMETAAAELPG